MNRHISEGTRLDILKLAVIICEHNADDGREITPEAVQVAVGGLRKAFDSLQPEEDVIPSGENRLIFAAVFPGTKEQQKQEPEEQTQE